MRKFIDKIKPAFEKGGKFGFLHSTFDAFESFLYVPDTVTRKGSHIRDCVDLKRIMIIMVLALVPAMLFGIWNTGYQHSLAFGLTDWGFWNIIGYGLVKVIPLYLVSYIVGLAIEFVSAQIRGHEVNEGYLVTGMIIPLIVPADVPLWMLALAVAFAVILGKEVFGGTGMNIWNPALLCRAFLFFSYPSMMSGDTIWTSGVTRYLAEGKAYASGNGLVDSFSGATPLAHPSVEGLQTAGTSLWDLVSGVIPGCVGETSAIAILIGAVILILIPLYAVYRYFRVQKLNAADNGILYAMFGVIITVYMALDGFYQPTILNTKSDKPIAEHIRTIVPEGRFYSYRSDIVENNRMHPFTVNFYLGDRIVPFDCFLPTEGYVLMGEEEVDTFRTRYPDYELTDVYNTAHKSCDDHRINHLYYFKKTVAGEVR